MGIRQHTLVTVISLLICVASSAVAQVTRDSSQVVLAHNETANGFGSSWELNFYRNMAYSCGLSGNYSFLVVEPADNPGAEAPLWVFLHGGGSGYFDDNQVYRTLKNQDQDTWNHEETFDDLFDGTLLRLTFPNNVLKDVTLARRMGEGYRMLLVSMCDHDLYSGRGAPYLNNPNGGQVNGLQATMAAVDYTVENYPTTHVFAHGTSAGSIGVFALATGYVEEGTSLTGIVADSYLADPRLATVFDNFAGEPGYPFDTDFDTEEGAAKIGHDYLGLGLYPGAMVANGFTDVPSMFIVGQQDHFCGGTQPTLIPEAELAGLSNCAWFADDLRQAIDNQPDTPHVLDLSPTGGHGDTGREGPINDRVDTFVSGVLATNPPHPFAPAGC